MKGRNTPRKRNINTGKIFHPILQFLLKVPSNLAIAAIAAETDTLLEASSQAKRSR